MILPAHPHIPGRTPRPQSGAFFDIARAAPNLTDPLLWRDNPAWLAGFDLYAAGCYWETHEVWEPVWMNAVPNAPERALVQGLIHIANSCLKLVMDRRKAARRLAGFAAECLGNARSSGRSSLMGVDLLAVFAETERFRTLIADPSVAANRLLVLRPDLRTVD